MDGSISEGVGLDYMFIVRPAEVEEMMIDAHITRPPEMQQRWIEQLKLWPDTWNGLQVEIDERLQE